MRRQLTVTLDEILNLIGSVSEGFPSYSHSYVENYTGNVSSERLVINNWMIKIRFNGAAGDVNTTYCSMCLL